MTPEEIERQRRKRRIREQALINRAQSDRGWMGDSSPGGGIYALDPDTGGGVSLALATAWLTAYWNSSVAPISFSPSGAAWVSNFNKENFLPIASANKTYWVDVVAGLDSNDGSQALPFKSIWKAHQAATADAAVTGYVIRGKFGRYNRANGFDNSSSNPATKPFWFVAEGGRVIVGTFEALTWTNDGSGTNTYQATRSNVAQVLSTDTLNAYGNYPDHVAAADLAALRASSGINGWVQVSGTVYAKRADGSAVTDANTLAPLILSGPAFTKNICISGVDFVGSTAAGSGAVRLNPATANAIFEDCTFKNTGSASVETAGVAISNWTGYAIFNRCGFGGNSWDGINPHWTSTVTPTPPTYVVLLDCFGSDFGRAGGDSYNAVTSHEAIPVIDMNGNWGRGRGGTVRIVTGSKYLGLASKSVNDIGSPGLLPSQYRADDAATDMLLLDCLAAASPASNISLQATTGGSVRYHNLTNVGVISGATPV